MQHSVMKEIFENNVDIYVLPESIKDQYLQYNQITIGDLHANAMKLLFMLFKHGIASGIQQTEYLLLKDIYMKQVDALTNTDINVFNQVLSSIKFNNVISIRLIGDDLADRGQNDYFILKSLDKLQQHQVPVEILISNHDMEFIIAYEKMENFSPSLIKCFNQVRSMDNLQTLINNNIVTREDILTIVEKSYKPNLKAISYVLVENTKDMIIYSHAPIGLDNIVNLAQQLDIECTVKTARDIADSIDKINSKFQEYVDTNTVYKLCSNNPEDADSQTALEFILWNREVDKLNRPEILSNYHIYFVHGHDSSFLSNNNIVNLDNLLGKTVNHNRGKYHVIYSCKAIKSNLILNQNQENQNSQDMIQEMKQVYQNYNITVTRNLDFTQIHNYKELALQELMKIETIFQIHNIQKIADIKLKIYQDAQNACNKYAVTVTNRNSDKINKLVQSYQPMTDDNQLSVLVNELNNIISNDNELVTAFNCLNGKREHFLQEIAQAILELTNKNEAYLFFNLTMQNLQQIYETYQSAIIIRYADINEKELEALHSVETIKQEFNKRDILHILEQQYVLKFNVTIDSIKLQITEHSKKQEQRFVAAGDLVSQFEIDIYLYVLNSKQTVINNNALNYAITNLENMKTQNLVQAFLLTDGTTNELDIKLAAAKIQLQEFSKQIYEEKRQEEKRQEEIKIQAQKIQGKLNDLIMDICFFRNEVPKNYFIKYESLLNKIDNLLEILRKSKSSVQQIQQSSQELEDEIKKHRGWHSHPVLKAIIGSLLIIPVIIAAIMKLMELMHYDNERAPKMFKNITTLFFFKAPSTKTYTLFEKEFKARIDLNIDTIKKLTAPAH